MTPSDPVERAPTPIEVARDSALDCMAQAWLLYTLLQANNLPGAGVMRRLLWCGRSLSRALPAMKALGARAGPFHQQAVELLRRPHDILVGANGVEIGWGRAAYYQRVLGDNPKTGLGATLAGLYDVSVTFAETVGAQWSLDTPPCFSPTFRIPSDGIAGAEDWFADNLVIVGREAIQRLLNSPRRWGISEPERAPRNPITGMRWTLLPRRRKNSSTLSTLRGNAVAFWNCDPPEGRRLCPPVFTVCPARSSSGTRAARTARLRWIRGSWSRRSSGQPPPHSW
jgi:hypothetical protein